MIDSCKCPITGARLLPTCPITTLHINYTADYAPIAFEEIAIVMISQKNK